MSQFNYSQLEEQSPESDASQPRTGSGHEEILTSLADESTTVTPRFDPGESSHSSHSTNNNNNYNNIDDGFGHSYNSNHSGTPSQANVKYTALKPSSPPQGVAFSEDEESSSGDNLDSVIQLRLLPTPRKKRCSRVNVALCVLLAIFVVLVAVAMIYVFVIFPSRNGKVTFADGKMHTEDLAKLRKLDGIVAITSCGIVRGILENGAYIFKGIPYAEPPVGSKRWRPPFEMSYHTNSCWSDVLNATQFGSQCVQPKYDDINSVQGDEDCLFLNVWTPSLNPADNLLPVLVWIHSGDFVHGSGHMPGMSPSSEVALATNAVYVSMNYRLGAFGFLALDLLRDHYRGPTGNYGIMDQVVALRWVKENIRHFGGNELDVTIFGHGSGATSVQALLQSGQSSHLFHRAWMTSPTAILNKTLGEACKDNKQFLRNSGCSHIHCLMELSPLEVSKASPWSLLPYWTIDEIFREPYHSQIRNDLAIYDGEMVHWTMSDVGPSGADVPVIFGTTYFELSNLKTEASVVNLTMDSYNALLVDQASSLGTDAVIEIKKLYSDLPRLRYTSPVHFPPFPSAAFAHLVGDVKNVCPMKSLSESLNFVFSSPVYMYVAEIYPSHNILLSSNEVNSFIGWDVIAFFNGFEALNFVPGQGDLNFMLLLREEIMSFIRKGKPSALRWKTIDDGIGVISNKVTVNSAPLTYLDKCKFWKRHGYFDYTWIKKS